MQAPNTPAPLSLEAGSLPFRTMVLKIYGAYAHIYSVCILANPGATHLGDLHMAIVIISDLLRAEIMASAELSTAEKDLLVLVVAHMNVTLHQ